MKKKIIFLPSNPENTKKEDYDKLIKAAVNLGFDTYRWWESKPLKTKKNS